MAFLEITQPKDSKSPLLVLPHRPPWELIKNTFAKGGHVRVFSSKAKPKYKCGSDTGRHGGGDKYQAVQPKITVIPSSKIYGDVEY